MKQNKKKYQKMSFSVISQKILIFCWVSKIPLFDNLAQKARTPKTLQK